MLDSLTALYAAWRAGYDHPTVSADAAAAWLDRWLPATPRAAASRLGSCDRNGHQADSFAAVVTRLFDADYQAFVAADVGTRPPPALISPQGGDAPGRHRFCRRLVVQLL